MKYFLTTLVCLLALSVSAQETQIRRGGLNATNAGFIGGVLTTDGTSVYWGAPTNLQAVVTNTGQFVASGNGRGTNLFLVGTTTNQSIRATDASTFENNVDITGELNIGGYPNVADSLDLIYAVLPNTITNLPSSVNIKTFLDTVPNDTDIRLAPGTFAVTPTIWNSNLVTGTAVGGVILQNKTNITIQAERGKTILDGSGGLGEVLIISNCNNITIRGLSIRGMTNYNPNALPGFGGGTNDNNYLWAGVQIFRSANILFEGNDVYDHADHGIQDKGAESSVASAQAHEPISTNNIRIIGNRFWNIGMIRTNQAGGLAGDGTAIVCTGWEIAHNEFRNNFRDVEPYNGGESGAAKFFNFWAHHNKHYDTAEHAYTMAGSTNCDYAIIEDNEIYYTKGSAFHGESTDGTFNGVSPSGIHMNGGNYPKIRRNKVFNQRGAGILVGTSVANPIVGPAVVDNTVIGTSNAVNQGFGIVMGDTSNTRVFAVRNAYVAGNYVSLSKTYAFYGLGLADSIIENNQFIEPLFPGAGAALVLQSSTALCSNNVVRGNQIHDLGTSQMTYGIQFTAGVLASEAFGNDIKGGSSGEIDNDASTEIEIYETKVGTTDQIARLKDITGGGSGGTNAPAVINLAGQTNLPVVSGIRGAFYLSTNGNSGMNIPLTVPPSGQTLITIWKNTGSQAITNNLFTNSIAATFDEPLDSTNVATSVIVPAGGTVISRWTYILPGTWQREELAAPATRLIAGSGITETAGGVNGLDRTWSVQLPRITIPLLSGNGGIIASNLAYHFGPNPNATPVTVLGFDAGRQRMLRMPHAGIIKSGWMMLSLNSFSTNAGSADQIIFGFTNVTDGTFTQIASHSESNQVRMASSWSLNGSVASNDVIYGLMITPPSWTNPPLSSSFYISGGLELQLQ